MGWSLDKTAAATAVRRGIEIAFGGNKADMEAAYPILEQGGARIGEVGPTDAEHAKNEGVKRELGALKQNRTALTDQLDVLQTTHDRLQSDATNELNTPEEQKAAKLQLKDVKSELDDVNKRINNTDELIKQRQQAVSDFEESIPPTAEDVKGRIANELNNGRKALNSPVVSDAAKANIRKWIPAYERALGKFDELAPKTVRVKEAYDAAQALRAKYDPDSKYTQDYASRVYELNKLRGDSPLPPESLIGGGKSGLTLRASTKTRKYDTIMDAMIGRQGENGKWESETPKSLNVADLAANHERVTQDIVGNKILNDEFETTSYPETNEPVFVPAPDKDHPLPPNYVRVQGPFGKDAYVYKPVADLFKSIWGESQLRNSDIGNTLLKVSGAVKHLTLALDTFHLSRVYQKAFMEAVASGDW